MKKLLILSFLIASSSSFAQGLIFEADRADAPSRKFECTVEINKKASSPTAAEDSERSLVKKFEFDLSKESNSFAKTIEVESNGIKNQLTFEMYIAAQRRIEISLDGKDSQGSSTVLANLHAPIAAGAYELAADVMGSTLHSEANILNYAIAICILK